MLNTMMQPMYGMADDGGGGFGYGPSSGEYSDAGMVQESSEYMYFVVFHCFLVILSLFINGTMNANLITMRKKLFESTFYMVVAGLMTFTTLKTIIQAILVVPQYIEKTDPFSDLYRKIIFTIDTLADYGVLSFSTLMAANRFSTFNRGCKCPIFVRPVIFYLIGLVLLIICSFTGVLSGLGCTRVYSSPTNTYVDTCPDTGAAPVIEKVAMFLYYAVCLSSASFYVRTYWLIRHQRGYLMTNEQSRCGPEFVILKQAVVIFGLYLCSITLSTITPYLCDESAKVYFYLTYALNVVSLLISAAFPGLFLTSSKEFRREIRSWFGKAGIYFPKKSTRITSATTITSRERALSFAK